MPYEDPEFPAAPKSIGIGSKHANTKWARIDALPKVDNPPQLFANIAADSIAQGELGDCWLLAAISCVADFPGHIMDLFEPRAYNPDGWYEVRLYDIASGWTTVKIDDRVPVLSFGAPCFAQVQRGMGIWTLLLEKAFAKFCGSYRALNGGGASWAYQVLTGITEQLSFSRKDNSASQWQMWQVDVQKQKADPSKWRGRGMKACTLTSKAPVPTYDPEELFGLLGYFDQCQCVMSASIDGDVMEKRRTDGLVENHAYSVLQVLKAEDVTLIQLRNPWGKKEWNGRFSDASKDWDDNPQLAKDVGHEIDQDGEFWMPWEDFVRIFSEVKVAPGCLCVPKHSVTSGKKAGGLTCAYCQYTISRLWCMTDLNSQAHGEWTRLQSGDLCVMCRRAQTGLQQFRGPFQRVPGIDQFYQKPRLTDPEPPRQKPLCRFGPGCYRHNPEHFAEASHPWLGMHFDGKPWVKDGRGSRPGTAGAAHRPLALPTPATPSAPSTTPRRRASAAPEAPDAPATPATPSSPSAAPSRRGSAAPATPAAPAPVAPAAPAAPVVPAAPAVPVAPLARPAPAGPAHPASKGRSAGAPSLPALPAPACVRPGCSKPTWNGKAGEFCSTPCRDLGALPPVCERPGCGKPTWNGKAGEYCSVQCKGAPATCERPGCGKPTWNGKAGEYCGKPCRDLGPVAAICARVGCGKPSWNGKVGEYCGKKCQTVAATTCPRPGCGKPSWNGAQGEYCSKPCKAAHSAASAGPAAPTKAAPAKVAAPAAPAKRAALCATPGCGKPTWNGQAGEYCSKFCKDAASTGVLTKTSASVTTSAAIITAAGAMQHDSGTIHAMLNLARNDDWLACMDMLSRHAGLVNQRPSGRNWAVVHRAAAANNMTALRRIIEEFGGDPVLLTGNGKTPLQVAKKCGDKCKDAAAYLARVGSGDEPEAVRLLEVARRRRWPEVWALIREHPSIVNFQPARETSTVLHIAAKHGDVGAVQLLVEVHDADTDATDSKGSLPSDVARSSGHEAVAAYFSMIGGPQAVRMERFVEGAEERAAEDCAEEVAVPEESDASAAFYEAVRAAREGRWEKMFAAFSRSWRGSVNLRPPARHWAAVHHAARAGEVSVLRRLVEELGADPALPTADGTTTPAEVATKHGRTEAAAYLKGAKRR